MEFVKGFVGVWVATMLVLGVYAVAMAVITGEYDTFLYGLIIWSVWIGIFSLPVIFAYTLPLYLFLKFTKQVSALAYGGAGALTMILSGVVPSIDRNYPFDEITFATLIPIVALGVFGAIAGIGFWAATLRKPVKYKTLSPF